MHSASQPVFVQVSVVHAMLSLHCSFNAQLRIVHFSEQHFSPVEHSESSAQLAPKVVVHFPFSPHIWPCSQLICSSAQDTVCMFPQPSVCVFVPSHQF
jgi:hypothetical protein